MKPATARLLLILGSLLCLGGAAWLIGYAFRDNMLFYYAPSDVAVQGTALAGRKIRVGGLVKEDSVRTQGLDVSFAVTDGERDMEIRYRGLLPPLFREGQGMIAVGTLREDGGFSAESLLAKHDETYMPPEVAESLKGGRGKLAP
jgi:cytochrome c-type biogenesis protein CcmE